MFRFRMILGILVIPVSFLIIGCSSKKSSTTQPSMANMSGVWTGQWVSGQNGSEGQLCIEFQQSGTELTATFYFVVRGRMEGMRGSMTENEIVISGSGWQFSATMAGNTLNGTYTAPDDEGTWEAQRDPEKASCGWADQAIVDQFQVVLSNLRNPETGRSLASFITEVPLVDVKIGDATAQDWWACIWEVDDRVMSQKYTLGGVFGPHPSGGQQAGVGWMTTRIHRQSFSLGLGQGIYDENLGNGFGNAGMDVYVSTSGEYKVENDTDPNYTRPLLYRSPCENGQRFEVRMTELTGHFEMRGRNLTGGTLSIRIPPSGDYDGLGALHVIIKRCS